MNAQRYSVSKIKTFKQCKRLFKYKYIDKLAPTQTSIALQKGDFIHRLIEQSIIKNKMLEESDVIQYKEEYNFSDDNFKEYYDIYKNFCSSDVMRVIKSLPQKKYVENWINFNSKLEPTENSKGSFFVGKIDYYVIDKNKNIALSIDWKTGRKKRRLFSTKWLPT